MYKCDICGKEKKDTSYEPCLTNLVFGPFPGMRINYERRCSACEKKIAKKIESMLK